jgi:hypothetical protein
MLRLCRFWMRLSRIRGSIVFPYGMLAEDEVYTPIANRLPTRVSS